jgi:hypothetical protein
MRERHSALAKEFFANGLRGSWADVGVPGVNAQCCDHIFANFFSENIGILL